ncbi:hypothetical protein CQW23_18182 [Capsicum baccatum]|uniref:F-box domain-containing protein n=1 Tax=Capsicum baccatum TaxID=33114 RepID=A0A2G2WFX9_CAPBA|nr:hypothetical protein CQW23_18182 [Capsicum baccatum]
MDETAKRHCTGEVGGGSGGEKGGGSSDGDSEPSMGRFTDHIIIDVLEKMDLASLCTAACVSPTLNSAVAYRLPSASSSDLSGFYLDEKTLKHVVRRVPGAKSLTIECLRMRNDSSIINILGEHIEVLSLLKYTHLSYDILRAIGERCPNLRSLLKEFAGCDAPELFKRKLAEMLQKVPLLESLSITIRGTSRDVFDVRPLGQFLPPSLKKLKLQQTDARLFVLWLDAVRKIPLFNLRNLSLVLDLISDDLLITVVHSLPHLVELDLEDRPFTLSSVGDLTNIGLQALKFCECLIALSIVRSKMNCPASFTRVDNKGMFHVSEGCKRLESVKLGGFAKVTEAGYLSILYSCRNLKKFEVLTSPLLSDSVIDNMTGVARSVVELRLSSCSLLTSEALEHLSSFRKLEVLDTSGCERIGDQAPFYISKVTTLTRLNLAKARITDVGLALLGAGDLPIVQLCIRKCEKVTDKGIKSLFHADRKICKTLSVLDVGYIPKITDEAIFTIATAAKALTDLSLRFCNGVTDAAVQMLMYRPNHNSSQLQMLDLCSCRGLSAEAIMLPLPLYAFHRLRWLSIGLTDIVAKRGIFSAICEARPKLVVCGVCCDFGCCDGWQWHKVR